jgi:hypothetical protein
MHQTSEPGRQPAADADEDHAPKDSELARPTAAFPADAGRAALTTGHSHDMPAAC